MHVYAISMHGLQHILHNDWQYANMNGINELKDATNTCITLNEHACTYMNMNEHEWSCMNMNEHD